MASRFISHLFHPVFLNFMVAVLLLFVHPYLDSKLQTNTKNLHVLVLLINTVILPLILIAFLKYRDQISSFELPFQKERNRVYWLMAIVFAITTFQMWNNDFPYLLIYYLLAISVGLIVLAIVNIFLKVSMHAVSIAGAFGLFLYLILVESLDVLFPYLIGIIILGGIIGSARLYLKAHSAMEVWIGYLIGAITTFTTIWILTTA